MHILTTTVPPPPPPVSYGEQSAAHIAYLVRAHVCAVPRESETTRSGFLNKGHAPPAVVACSVVYGESFACRYTCERTAREDPQRNEGVRSIGPRPLEMHNPTCEYIIHPRGWSATRLSIPIQLYSVVGAAGFVFYTQARARLFVGDGDSAYYLRGQSYMGARVRERRKELEISERCVCVATGEES